MKATGHVVIEFENGDRQEIAFAELQMVCFRKHLMQVNSDTFPGVFWDVMPTGEITIELTGIRATKDSHGIQSDPNLATVHPTSSAS